MTKMTKRERLDVEELARAAIGERFHCKPERAILKFGNSSKEHEFDIFAEGILIGGVSTSTLKTSGNNHNTSSCDRAASELLWLSLWPGKETRIHILSNLELANWILEHYQGLNFPHPLTIFHYNINNGDIKEVGKLSR